MSSRSSSCAPHTQKVHGLILAAGGSSRMGSHKALLPKNGHPMVVHHIVALMDTCQVIRVVVGAQAAQVVSVLPPSVEVVENMDWKQTDLAASIRLGLAGWPHDAPVLVTPVDAAPAPSHVLQELVAHGAPAVACHNGQDGHPVLVHAGDAHTRLDKGTLRQVLTDAPRLTVNWPDATTSWNTKEEWNRWLTQQD